MKFELGDIQWTLNLRESILIDSDELLRSRMLINANSGGGKSHAIRLIAEKTFRQAQQFVLDLEGEYRGLREKFPYVIAGTGGDCAAEPRSAALLCRRLMELQTSAVLDISDLQMEDRRAFVKNFLGAVMAWKKWHPLLVFLDEAHLWAPESGHSEASEVVIDVMTRGRKRQIAGILATQRISKLSKDAAAEANNVMVGRAVLDLDMKRSGDILGMVGRDVQQLRTLTRGHFWVFGPAFSHQVVHILVGPTVTSPPEPGAVAPPTPAAPAEVTKILAQLADLPAEAQQEATDVAGLRQRVRELENAARAPVSPRNGHLAADAAEKIRRECEKRNAAALAASSRELHLRLDKQAKEHHQTLSRIDKAVRQGMAALEGIVKLYSLESPSAVSDNPKMSSTVSLPRPVQIPVAVPTPMTTVASGRSENGALPGGAKKLLRILAGRYPAGFTKRQVAQIGGMTASGGSFNNYISKLRVAGFLDERDGLFRASAEGLAEVGQVVEIPTDPDQVVEMWANKLGAGPGKILLLLADTREWTTKSAIAEAVGMTATGGSFNNYVSKLNTNGLIDKRGGLIRIAESLYA